MKPQLRKRLAGYQGIFSGVSAAGAALSNTTKGAERERFVELFLAQMFSTAFRFGTGDIIDQHGKSAPQIDVVIEYPFLPSFPLAGANSYRLYLAEGVAMAIEVKSDLSKSWTNVLTKAARMVKLSRIPSEVAEGTQRHGPPERIPYFAVGYTGWGDREEVGRRVTDSNVSGVLILDTGIYAPSSPRFGQRAIGEEGLLEFLSCIWDLANDAILGNTAPRQYL